MKKLFYVVAAVAFFSCGGGEKKTEEKAGKAEIKTNEDKVSYAIGVDAGSEIYGTIKMQGLDTIISKELLLQGLEDAIMDKGTLIPRNEAKQIIRDYFSSMQEKMVKNELKKYEANKTAGENFLAENKNKPGITTTASGLQYEVIKQGNGAKPVLNDSVTVHYKGTFLSGEVFDSSVERNEPFKFQVSYNSVIEGWVEAVQLMPKGSKYRFWIPYQMGYGDRFYPGIQPYSMLIFEIELLEIKKA